MNKEVCKMKFEEANYICKNYVFLTGLSFNDMGIAAAEASKNLIQFGRVMKRAKKKTGLNKRQFKKAMNKELPKGFII